MALYNRLYRSLLTVMILSLLAPLSIFAEEPEEEVMPPYPSIGYGNVNAVINEWNTTTDFYGNLYINGNSSGTPYARYYLRFDCRPANPIMYVYVQLIGTAVFLRNNTQWVNMDNITHTANFVGDNDNPPDFAWNSATGDPVFYEASWPVQFWLGTRAFDIHATVAIPTLGTHLLRTSDLSDPLILTTSACPLAVELNTFTATPQRDLVLLEWETVSETDNLGFNLYRSTSPDEIGEKLNGELIPSQSPGSGQGASYEFMDDKGVGGTSYYYRLEALDLHGNTTMHGPVNATYPAQPTAVTMALFNTEAHDPRWAFNLGALALGLAGCAVWRWRYRRRSHT